LLVNVLLERRGLALLAFERFFQLLARHAGLFEPTVQLMVDHLGVVVLSLDLNGELREFPLCGFCPLSHERQLLTKIVALDFGLRPALSLVL
jgi:hypothetical protein